MKTRYLKFLNPAILLLVVSQFVTGIFHDSIPENLYDVFHFYSGILLVVLVILHLYWNGSWIIQTYFKKKK